MARPLRVVVPGAWYHVMARGIERRTIYSDESYYRKFEELLANLPERFGVRLHTYVLMPNHYHLQIETPRLNLSEAIKWLNLSYVSWFNRKTRRNGPLLQGRFKAVVHDPDETGWTIHEYIHLNPVRVQRFGAGRSDNKGPSAEQMVEMIKELTEFKWSSYRSYAGYASAPKWLCTQAVMNWVPSSKQGGKRDQYRQRFLEMIGAGDLGISWKERLAGDLVLGGKDFVENIRKMLAGDRNEQKSLRKMEKPPVDWEKITSAIEKLWRKPWKEVSGLHGDPGRELAMLIAQRFGGMSLREIGKAVGGLRYPAVSDAIRRTSARLETDGVLERKFKRLRNILKL
ncbi:MAG TPA: transposase [Chthoniobacterales bacterium]|nr:transposase [Chthoniobacterales bacterium]